MPVNWIAARLGAILFNLNENALVEKFKEERLGSFLTCEEFFSTNTMTHDAVFLPIVGIDLLARASIM